MKAHFFDRHRGILGPGVPLPEAVAAVADRYEGEEAEVDEVLGAMRAATDGEVTDHAPGWVNLFGETIAEGMVTIQVPAEGYPAHAWRVIRYVPLATEGSR
jgi:hypothetical protein